MRLPAGQGSLASLVLLRQWAGAARASCGDSQLPWMPQTSRAFASSALPDPAEAPAAAAAAFPASTAHLTDLTLPASWYPIARGMRRRVVAHLGPTNSGKTHAALEALRAAPSGLYAGPLRLLAWQAAERLTAGGAPCSLVTGQEVRAVGGARHTACTVEMASTRRRVDAAVIDEVQLMGGPSRGWAFTRALLGVPAATVHVCGDPAVLPLLRVLCNEAGEALEVRHYERLGPLTPGRRPLECLSRVRPGDALIAFSRREVHALRAAVEATAGRRCAVVYGSLPPSARRQQAALFNAPRSGVSVLAALDAVGMGLNLAIQRVVFTTMEKYDGQAQRGLTPAEVKQIAGRAGRFGTRYPAGVATTLAAGDLPALREAMAAASAPVAAAALFPRFQALAGFAGAFPGEGLSGILDRFAAQASVGPHFFFAHFAEMRALAAATRHLPLTLAEAFTFASAPADPGDEAVAGTLLTLATAFAQRRPVTSTLVAHAPLGQAASAEALAQLEATHRHYDLYIWLSYMFDAFQGREAAEAAREVCSVLIDASIREMGAATAAGRGVWGG